MDIREGLESLRESIRKLTRTPRLLVIEDSGVDMEHICKLLSQLSQCELLEAYTGEQGITQIVSSDHDIIFLDLTLPGMSGLDVIHQMSESERRKTVVVTGMFEEAEEIKEAIRLGAVKVLTKPVNRDDLKAIFNRPI